MAGIQINALPAVPSAQLTDVFPVDQGPTTYKETNAQLLSLFKANGEALTSVNDTNVTMALSGAPSISLLNATSMTLGWTGQLSVPRGGSGNSTFTAYSIICAGTTTTGSFQNVSGLGNAGEQLTSNGPGALPTWQPSSSVTPAALTKADDTNVTLTLGGTPATALLQATSITAGWTGQLSSARGGTGVNNGTSTLTLGGNLTTSGAFASTFTMTGITGVTFPTSGTLATTSQLVTPAALTKTDDTNVTVTLGGSPSTALVNAASLTLGWTGTLSGTRGGTGVNNGASTATYAGNLNFASSFTTSGAFAVTQTYTGITNVTFPTSGTLATTSQIPTGAALTKTDDTNITLTLGGSPTTALVNAASLTLGWTGQLAATRGGTGLGTVTQGDLLYGSAANTWSALAKDTNATRYLSNTGTTNNPAWTQVNVANGVTGTLPIANGGTAVTSVTTSPTATSFAGWDTNKNLSANNLIEGFTTTATAAGTTTLTVASTYFQVFTGSTTQTVVMPVTSTLVQGQSWQIINASTGIVTINSSGSNLIISLQPSTSAIVTCVLTSGTTAASWITSFSQTGGSGIIDSWVQYTPTFQGFGTPTAVNIWSRRVGGNLEVRGSFACGTVTGANAQITLGYQGTNSNVTISSTVVNSQNQIVGTVVQGTTGASAFYNLGLAGNGFFTFGVQNSTKAGYTDQLANAIFSNGQVITFMVSVPITGWS